MDCVFSSTTDESYCRVVVLGWFDHVDTVAGHKTNLLVPHFSLLSFFVQESFVLSPVENKKEIMVKENLPGANVASECPHWASI